MGWKCECVVGGWGEDVGGWIACGCGEWPLPPRTGPACML